MKIKDLIAELKKLDPEMDALVYNDEADRFYAVNPEDLMIVYDLKAKTRDFKSVTPPGTTSKFLCLF